MAGGKSSRMGTDKGLLKYNNKTFVEVLADKVSPFISKVLIMSNNKSYYRFGCDVYPDEVLNCGPMGGIYTALRKSDKEFNFIVSCDIPLLTSEIIKYIIASSDKDFEINIVSYDSKKEPLCAVYSKRCIVKIKEMIDAKKYKLHDVLTLFKVNSIHIPQALAPQFAFENINTIQQYYELINGTPCYK